MKNKEFVFKKLTTELINEMIDEQGESFLDKVDRFNVYLSLYTIRNQNRIIELLEEINNKL